VGTQGGAGLTILEPVVRHFYAAPLDSVLCLSRFSIAFVICAISARALKTREVAASLSTEQGLWAAVASAAFSLS
jgi:hypothetical protein